MTQITSTTTTILIIHSYEQTQSHHPPHLQPPDSSARLQSFHAARRVWSLAWCHRDDDFAIYFICRIAHIYHLTLEKRNTQLSIHCFNVTIPRPTLPHLAKKAYPV